MMMDVVFMQFSLLDEDVIMIESSCASQKMFSWGITPLVSLIAVTGLEGAAGAPLKFDRLCIS